MFKKLVTNPILIISVIVYVLFLVIASNLMDKISQLNVEKADLQNTISNLREENLYLTNRVSWLELENSESLIAVERYSAEVENAYAEISELSSEIFGLGQAIERLEERSKYVFNGKWNYDYTEEEVKLLAAVMFGENEGNRWEMMLTGSVVLNRVLSPDFPDTVREVIYQRSGQYEQYAPRTKRIAESVLAGEPISKADADLRYLPDYYYDLARILLEYGPIAPEKVIYQAHFNQGDIYWEWKGEQFCY